VTFRELRSEPLDDLVRRGAALGLGLSVTPTLAPLLRHESNPPAADRSYHASEPQDLLDNARDLLQLALHQLKDENASPHASPYSGRCPVGKGNPSE